MGHDETRSIAKLDWPFITEAMVPLDYKKGEDTTVNVIDELGDG